MTSGVFRSVLILRLCFALVGGGGRPPRSIWVFDENRSLLDFAFEFPHDVHVPAFDFGLALAFGGPLWRGREPQGADVDDEPAGRGR